MKITKIVVTHDIYGPDRITLVTDLPEGSFPFIGNQWFSGAVAADAGIEYCKKHFPDIEIEEIAY